MTRWQYDARIVRAPHMKSQGVEEYLSSEYGGIQFNTYSPHSLEPVLNKLGEDGWELISLTPVLAGKNDDIAHPQGGPGGSNWSNAYLAVFKRPVPDSDAEDAFPPRS